MTSQPYVLPSSWETPSEEDNLLIIDLLGKDPRGEYQVVFRNEAGQPSVIENAPFFFDGTPMPTRYWLVDPDISSAVAKLESSGGVKQVQDEIDHATIMSLHARYQQDRDAMIAPNYDGPRPSAGVGGTRRGVKCLHTHVAHYLVTHDDVVGEWAMKKIAEEDHD